MRRHLLLTLVLLSLATLALGSPPPVGTPNLPFATTYQYRAMAQVDVRFYNSGNDTLALGVVTRLAPRTDLTVWYTHFSNDSHSPLADAVRDSRWSGLSFALKQELKNDGGRVKVALVPSVELGLTEPNGINDSTGAFARQNRITPGLAVPVEWRWGQADVVACPQLMWFERNIDDSTGGVTKGFGTVFSVGLGARYPLWRGHAVADLVLPLSGDNSLNTGTNLPNRKGVWSLGWETGLGRAEATRVALYATNGAGPSPATAIIGTPGNGVGLGVRLGHTF